MSLLASGGVRLKITNGHSWSGLNRSLDGMKRNARGMAQAADDVRVSTQATLNGLDGLPTDRVQMRGPVDLEDGLIDLKLNKHGYTANLKAAKATDDVFQAMIDMVLPHGSGDRSS